MYLWRLFIDNAIRVVSSRNSKYIRLAKEQPYAGASLNNVSVAVVHWQCYTRCFTKKQQIYTANKRATLGRRKPKYCMSAGGLLAVLYALFHQETPNIYGQQKSDLRPAQAQILYEWRLCVTLCVTVDITANKKSTNSIPMAMRKYFFC